MRDLAITLMVLAGCVWTLRWPYVGILMWTWITLMDPHQLSFGFSQSLQINFLVAVVTLGSLLLSKERKFPPIDANLVLMGLFFLWFTMNCFFAADPGSAWYAWDRTWRIMLLGVLVSITATNRVRIHALVMMMALSLLYYGVKGGGFTLMTGGGNHVDGPPNSTISDNNQLALAILMVIPLANYLRMYAANMLVRRIYLAGMVLSLFAVLGSYSRGAFIALAGLAVVGWFRVRQKLLYPIAAAILIVPALYFMPDSFYDRMNTINTAGQDSSFQGRLDAWWVALGYARDHFPIGAGFDGPQKPWVFGTYAPGKDTHAAHSIFFEVLGDQGFGGLAIYLLLLGVCIANAMTVRRLTKGRPEFAWAYDLAGMLQLTLFVFCLGGAALSFAYYDGFFISCGLLSVLRELVIQSSTEAGWRKGPAKSRVARGALPEPSLVVE